MRCLAVFLICSRFFLSSCQDSHVEKSPDKIPELISGFQSEDVIEITITDGRAKTRILKDPEKDGWEVKYPFKYPAETKNIGSFLLSLKNCKLIQAVKCSPEDYPRLQLSEPNENEDSDCGISVVLTMSNGETRSIVFGSILNPVDQTDAFALGISGTKNRYVRKGKDIYVVDNSFHRLSVDANLWIDNVIIPISRPLNFRAWEGNDLKLDLSRKSPYAGFVNTSDQSQSNVTDAKMIDYVEKFFAGGRVYGVHSEQLSQNHFGLGKGYRFEVIDSLGLKFSISAGENSIDSQRATGSFSKLSSGIFNEDLPEAGDLHPIRIRIDNSAAKKSRSEFDRLMFDQIRERMHQTIYLAPVKALVPPLQAPVNTK